MRWEIPAFFDPHVHLREGDMMVRAIAQTSLFCDRVCAMLNLSEPLDDEGIVNYARTAQQHVAQLERSMTVWPVPLLNDGVTANRIKKWAKRGVRSVKYMPRGATTNSHHGVTHPAFLKQNGVLNCMSELGLILQVHAEAPPGPDGPTMAWTLGAEREFIDTFCDIAVDYSGLKMIFEHVSTKQAIQAIRPFRNVAATVTPHHLTMTVDDVLDLTHKWVANPHNYCRSIAKREEDREALIEAACSDNERVFFGSDYAPHSA